MTSNSAAEDDIEVDSLTKVLYCSRTHSQLTQFANEVRRVKIPFAQDKDVEAPEETKDDLFEEIKHLSLGSRKNLCINEGVKKLGNPTAINERCLDLQSKTTADKKCPYLPRKENETLVHQFRDLTLAKIRDIEDLADLGKHIGICPYYASRATIKSSEVSVPLITAMFAKPSRLSPFPILYSYRSLRERLSI